jgi:hypothetical protein
MLRGAAACIRGTGLRGYADPVLDRDGRVYTDQRTFRDAGIGDVDDPRWIRLMRSCGDLVLGAGFFPYDEAPAPAQLVAAGTAAARCLRSHGLPMFADPTSASPFTPGHGFGITAADLPYGETKAAPDVQRAFRACRPLLDAEIDASRLAALADD